MNKGGLVEVTGKLASVLEQKITPFLLEGVSRNSLQQEVYELLDDWSASASFEEDPAREPIDIWSVEL